MLDRQIADAPPRVEPMRLKQGPGRAGVETSPACPARIGLQRRVISQRFAGEQGRQDEPTPQPLVDEHRVLADPAQAGQPGEFPLQQRRGVGHASDAGLGGQTAMKIGQLPQAGTQEVVIIGAPGASGDSPLPRLRRDRLGRAVGNGQHQQAPHPRQNVPRMLVGRGPIGHALHLTGHSVGQPLSKMPNPRRNARRRRAGQVETQPAGLSLQRRRQVFG